MVCRDVNKATYDQRLLTVVPGLGVRTILVTTIFRAGRRELSWEYYRAESYVSGMYLARV